MDTSKFSLPGALRVLRTYFEWLSFKPLSVYVSDEIKDGILGGIPCQRWPRWTMIPACVTLDERVYAIPLHRLRSPDRNVERDFDGLIEWRLLVRRELENHSVCYLQTSRVSWHPHESRPPFAKSTITLVDCDKFRTRSLEDDISDSIELSHGLFVRKYGSFNLHNAFWKGAQEWAEESLRPREKAVVQLTHLAQHCSAKWYGPEEK